MAKPNKFSKEELNESSGQQEQPEMTMEEARAYRASLHRPEQIQQSPEEQRNEFRMWWAEQKSRFGMGKDLEPILWMHLKAIGMTSPESFEAGMQNFGLKSK